MRFLFKKRFSSVNTLKTVHTFLGCVFCWEASQLRTGGQCRKSGLVNCRVNMSVLSPQGLPGADPWQRSRCVLEEVGL